MAVLEDRAATCASCGEEFIYTRRVGGGGKPRSFCDECLKIRGPGGKRRMSIQLSTQDWGLLEEIQQKLGVETSEAVRTSIRVYNILLKK